VTERIALNAFLLVEVVFVGGFLLLYPRIARKGLLFGVYVGEERSQADAARGITRAWYRGMIASLAVALAAGAVFATRPESPFGALAPLLILLLAFAGLYLIAYRRARRLAAPFEPPPEAAPLVPTPEPSLVFPWAVLLIATVAGLWAVFYTLARYAALPDPMPTHFGISGQPDAWSKKSFGSVMVLPIMTLVLGVMVGGTALLTGRAKRAPRQDDGASLAVQNRFRSAMSRFVAVLGLLLTAMLTTLAVTSVQVALGERRALPAAALLFALAIFCYAIFGSAWLAVRYGQGGARLEKAQSNAPLTDGLADNRLWKLGMFYVNRDDPSWLVERRFGFGYTLNFGNPGATATFAAFMAAILGLATWAIVSGS
jgi:uncharacterized membrane protein